MGYRPSLDGVRALAILPVLASHVPGVPSSGGFVGVDLFFVLSGFLITSLLLEEWNQTGGISLRRFYARRALRLLPALLFTLGLVFFFSHLRESAEDRKEADPEILIVLLYSSNWFAAFGKFPHGVLGTTWSLSIEEQYYLFWPLALSLLFRLRCRRGLLVLLLGLAIAASAAARAYWWSALGRSDRAYFGTDCRADGLLIGSLLALLASWGFLPRRTAVIRLANLVGLAGLAFYGSVVYSAWLGAEYLYYWGFLAINLATAALIVSLVSSPWPVLRRVLESVPLVWLGRLSYVVYLLHGPAIWIFRLLGWGDDTRGRLLAIGATLLFALPFHLGVERPILRFKRRFSAVASV